MAQRRSRFRIPRRLLWLTKGRVRAPWIAAGRVRLYFQSASRGARAAHVRHGRSGQRICRMVLLLPRLLSGVQVAAARSAWSR